MNVNVNHGRTVAVFRGQSCAAKIHRPQFQDLQRWRRGIHGLVNSVVELHRHQSTSMFAAALVCLITSKCSSGVVTPSVTEQLCVVDDPELDGGVKIGDLKLVPSLIFCVNRDLDNPY